MLWANFLHFYQPSDQQPDTLEAVVHQSYKPILEGILKSSRVRLTLNFTGSLLELLDKHGYTYLIDMVKKLVAEGKVELVGSCKYHAFLPLIPEKEGLRQMQLNTETLKFYFGKNLKLRGFFPPEMGYSEKLLPIVEECGFEWLILDEIAYAKGEKWPDFTKLYKVKGAKLGVFFRNRRVSNLIMSAVARSGDTLYEVIKNDILEKEYLVTAMDGETFGHHRPGLESLLFDIFDSPKYDLVQISDLLKLPLATEEVAPFASTWASSKKDIDEGAQFLSWFDDTNVIHKWQWEFLGFVQNELINYPNNKELRSKLDVALASDHFWWASAKPWWGLEMIESGAYKLLAIIRSIPDISPEKLAKANNLYNQIISTAFEWQRTGKIRAMARQTGSMLRIPFKDRTVGVGGAEEGVYRAFIDMMKQLEKTAAEKGEYEQAILWRDAIYKLDKKLDIYEVLNAVDLLRKHMPHDEIEKMVEKYKDQYRKIRGGQPEQRGA